MRIKRLATLSIATLLLAACQQNTKDTTKIPLDTSSNAAPIDEYTLTKVDKFEDYLSALDSTDINSMGKATAKFNELFTVQDTLITDEAILRWIAYQEKVLQYGNEKVIEPNTDYSALVDVEFNNKKTPEDLRDFQKQLNANGFRIQQSEGMYYIYPNPLFVEKNFYPYATPDMEIYLRQIAKENKEGFTSDAAIVIPFETLVQRTVWWEDFSKAQTTNPLHTKTKEKYSQYFMFLTLGTNNTPAIEYDDKASEYFTEAYAYLEEVYPSSQTFLTLKPYINMLRNGQIPQAKERARELVKSQPE